MVSKSKKSSTLTGQNEPETFVPEVKLTEAVGCVRKLHNVARESKKQALFEDDGNFVHLNILLKHVPLNFSTYIHHIQLPHHWRHEVNYETCLIVKDANRKALPDREEDLEKSKEIYEQILQQNGASALITDILPMRQLRNEFQAPALRKKLSAQYDAFLCDKNLLRNKFSVLSRFLGKAFWIDNKKIPILVSLEEANLKQQLETKLNQASLYVSGKGATLSVCVGSLSQADGKVVANIQAVLQKLRQIFPNNIRELAVKTDRTASIIFYLDLGSANLVKLTRPANSEETFVEDEFDFLTNSNVRVYRDGNVRVTKRPVDDNNEEMADDAEKLLIKSINRPVQPDWMRQKVLFAPKRHKSNKSTFTRTNSESEHVFF